MGNKITLACLIGLWVATNALAAEPTAAEVMQHNFVATKTQTLKSVATMTLVNDKGQIRERKIVSLSKLQKNAVDTKLLVRFLLPADIKGTGFLQIEHSEAEDDMWIYLPALQKSRRLVSNSKRESFVGSDFSYGDILLPKVETYSHAVLRAEPCAEQVCYVIESIPRDETVKRDDGYSRKVSWIRKDNYLESKVEYYDVTGRLLKTQSASDHRLVDAARQRWVAARREMVNHQTGHKTVLALEQVEAEIPISDEVFTTRTLERE